MLFEFKNTAFETSNDRKRFAQRLANIIEAMPEGWEPYIPPGMHDDYYWTLDRGNDWKVTFYKENPNRFSVTYRYQRGTPQAEESLGEWLKYRLHCTPIE